MKTSLIPITESNVIPTTLELLAKGGLVAFPTDTVYGIGADAFS